MKTDWEKVSKHIGQEDFFHKFVIDPECELLLDGTQNKVGADIGCGNGVFISKILKSGAKKMYAVDINSCFLDIAMRNNEKSNVEYILSDASKHIPLVSNTCDFVTQILVLHSIKNIEKVIAESYRILKKGGICIVVNPHPVALTRGHFINLIDFDINNYIDEQESIFEWKRNYEKAPMEFYSRPLNTYINSFIKAGFGLELMSEPVVPEDGRSLKSEQVFERLRKVPSFIFLKFKKL